jgi:hypothetical protein
MSKALITILLGISLAAFPLAAAVGKESAPQTYPAEPRATGDWSVPPLRPVPHLDTIQWLNSAAEAGRQPKIFGPQVDYLSPLLIDPSAPATPVLSERKAAGLRSALRPRERPARR